MLKSFQKPCHPIYATDYKLNGNTDNDDILFSFPLCVQHYINITSIYFCTITTTIITEAAAVTTKSNLFKLH